MKVLVVDDEPLARQRLVQMLEALPEAEVVGEAGNGRAALEQAERLQPDVVLMDIRMPGMDGLEAARHLAALETPPALIFTTAYGEHALEAFEAQAVDYLLKPVQRERLAEALARARRPNRAQMAELGGEAGSARTHICARVRGNLVLVPIEDVRYFHAEQKYVAVHHAGGEVLIEEPLKALEAEFGDRFLRIHRSTLVARNAIAGLEKAPDGGLLLRLRDDDTRLEVSRRHAPEVRRFVRTL
ncbi:MAG: DNA-binding response regulator [Gammaproteobacteria bacterium]|nr:MAG: DNA-binding response regulator [Gammaproteobacteria bacterium]